MSRGGRTNHGRGHYTRQSRDNELRVHHMRDPSVLGNPVALMSRMENELNEIRSLAISRGRRYQTAIRRLDCLEEALLAMFEVRLQLMENIILRPRFAAASSSLLVPSPSGSNRRLPAMLGVRDLEENLFFLKNRVRALQSRVNSFGGSLEHAPGPSMAGAEQPGHVGYAAIIKHELEKIVREEEEGRKLTMNGRSSDLSIPRCPANYSSLAIPSTRLRTSKSVPNKRSKFTC
ncbi:hypothetical protein GE061_006902 [Apolygus lucorum]|uniref:Uncharacterized protein n=1 Tax=Apolygus lucorum TaxID=248454 RepID=A0A6A4J9I3_APOLU|nr:hypothetical protein GE061_006902 [Apolygus lucorum]